LLHKKPLDDGWLLLIGRAFIGMNSMSLIQIKQAVRLLSLGQLRKLDAWLHELITRAEEADRAEQSSKRTVVEQALDNRTYRLESVRCGKENCKCARGKLHGPYWYSYTRVEDKVTSQYIGKKSPKDIERRLMSKNETVSKPGSA
jgi:hypothetical protein